MQVGSKVKTDWVATDFSYVFKSFCIGISKKIKLFFGVLKSAEQHLDIDFKPIGVIEKYCKCEQLLSQFSEKELSLCQ